MKLSSIHVNPKNPRTIKDSRFRKLCASIRDFPKMMEMRPILTDSEGMILGGNMRYKALKTLGYKEVPDTWVRRIDELTDEEKDRFIIADNVSYGEWDYEMLKAEWKVDLLDEWGLEFPETATEEKKAIEDNYEVPEEIETDILPGDIIDIDHHRIICGDSTKPETYEKLLGTRHVELVVTDPPYNVDYGQKAKMLDEYDKGHRNQNKIQNDNMSEESFEKFLNEFYTAVRKIMKTGAAIYVWHAESTSTSFRNTFRNAGFELRQCLIWVKNSLVLGRQDYQWKHEPCLYGWKPGAGHYFTKSRTNTTVYDDKIDFRKLNKAELLKIVEEVFSENLKTSVLYHNRPNRSLEHPTMKPVPLMGELITNSSKTGWLVLDPFIGSGGTMVAAHQLNRICYGIELDPKYVQVVIDRMRRFDPEVEVRKNGILQDNKVLT